MQARTTREALRAVLVDVDFPATKDQLGEAAGRHGADDDTLRALRAVPPVDYRNMDEVLASVPLADEAPEAAAAMQADRRRQHTAPGLAEGSKDV
jgi:ribosomal protein L12E/L44/L45/RPP1/RPP2